jgi:hypothetical protein
MLAASAAASVTRTASSARFLSMEKSSTGEREIGASFSADMGHFQLGISMGLG